MVFRPGSPGKLKHNLKINVGALMPGAAPPRLRDLPKSQSLDLPKDEAVTPAHPSSPDRGSFTPPVWNPRGDPSGTSSERAVSFEDALDNVEVLHSVTKVRCRFRPTESTLSPSHVLQCSFLDFIPSFLFPISRFSASSG